jgi:hypothetical protein
MNINVNFYGLIAVVFAGLILVSLALILLKWVNSTKKNIRLTKRGVELSEAEKKNGDKHSLVFNYVLSLQQEIDYIQMKGTKKKQLEKSENITSEFIDDLNIMFLDYFETELSADSDILNVNSRKLKLMTLIVDIISDKMRDRIKTSVDINHFNNRTGIEWDNYLESKIKLNIDLVFNTLKSNYDPQVLGLTLDPFLTRFESDIKSKIALKIKQLYEEMKKISAEDVKVIVNLEKQIKDTIVKSVCI